MRKGFPAVRNIFLIYIPLGNQEAMVHYEDTIRQKVSLERIYKHVQPDLRSSLARGSPGSRAKNGDKNGHRFIFARDYAESGVRSRSISLSRLMLVRYLVHSMSKT